MSGPGATQRLLGAAYLYAYAAAAWRSPRAAARFASLFLGLLGREALHTVDEVMYRRRRSYFSDEHNLSGLMGWEEGAVARHFPPAGRILVTAAGGGREVVELARRGYDARGYECNAALVEVAGRLLARLDLPGRASVEWLARDALPEPEVAFDGAIVGWSGYSLVQGREHRVRYLAGIRRLLAGDAPLLVSFFTREDGSPRARFVAERADRVRRLLGRPPVEVGDDLSPNFVHRFTRAEVEGELRDGGFRLVEFQPQGPGPYDSGFAVARPTPAEGGRP